MLSELAGTQIRRHLDDERWPNESWACWSAEGPFVADSSYVSRCHYCRMATASIIVNSGDYQVSVYGAVADGLGLPEGSDAMESQSLRAAAELADDVAVLRMLDRIEAS